MDLGLRKLLDFDQDLIKLAEVSFDCFSEAAALLGFLLLWVDLIPELNQSFRVEVSGKVKDKGLGEIAQLSLGVHGLRFTEEALREGLGCLQLLGNHTLFIIYHKI